MLDILLAHLRIEMRCIDADKSACAKTSEARERARRKTFRMGRLYHAGGQIDELHRRSLPNPACAPADRSLNRRGPGRPGFKYGPLRSVRGRFVGVAAQHHLDVQTAVSSPPQISWRTRDYRRLRGDEWRSAARRQPSRPRRCCPLRRSPERVFAGYPGFPACPHRRRGRSGPIRPMRATLPAQKYGCRRSRPPRQSGSLGGAGVVRAPE